MPFLDMSKRIDDTVLKTEPSNFESQNSVQTPKSRPTGCKWKSHVGPRRGGGSGPRPGLGGGNI